MIVNDLPPGVEWQERAVYVLASLLGPTKLCTIATTSVTDREILSEYFLQFATGQLPRQTPSELVGNSSPFPYQLPALGKDRTTDHRAEI